MKCGIIGLPNVGKSLIFNKLTNSSVKCYNYPFCTINPSIGYAMLQDSRLNLVNNKHLNKNLVYPKIKFIDIAGLIKGASNGEGLGNKFLDNIRHCDVILHVIRCFDDIEIIHVEDNIDAIRDFNIIETELILSDIKMLDNVIEKQKILIKKGYKIPTIEFLKKIKNFLNLGNKAIKYPQNLMSTKEKHIFNELTLLTNKPVLYILNINFNKNAKLIKLLLTKQNLNFYQVNINNIKIYNINKIITLTVKMLNLITFFTIGKKEISSWLIPRNTIAKIAAAKIHNDISKNFIKAEVINFNDYIIYNNYLELKKSGKIKLEGKRYIVQDGDIIQFRHN